MRLMVPTEIWAQKQMLRPKSCRPTIAQLEAVANSANGGHVIVSSLELCGMYPLEDVARFGKEKR